MQNRVVITGLGVISPVGTGLDQFWGALTSGVSGIDKITRFDPSGFKTQIAGEVKNFEPTDYIDKKEARRMDRFAQFAVAAAGMAIKDADLDLDQLDRDRAGVIVGSGIGGMQTFEDQCKVLHERGPDRVSPFFVPMMIANMASGQVAIAYGLRGPNITTLTACASSGNAVGDAFKLLQRGGADVVVAGGTEAPVTPLAIAGFCAMKAMSTRNEQPTRASRPFDQDRDGFIIGEGSAMLVMETLAHAQKRGARIYAEIVGYGSSCDAYHIVHPDPTGSGAARAMALALADSGLTAADIDYINAHGTSTPVGDTMENDAIKQVFGASANKLMISSTKSMTGHTLGAAGALESVVCILTIRSGLVPPTINLEHQDPQCDLDYVPNVARQAKVKYTLSNSFGFGGHNVSLAFSSFE